MATENLSGSVQLMTGSGRLVVRAGLFSFHERPVAPLRPVEPGLRAFRIDDTVCIHLQ